MATVAAFYSYKGGVGRSVTLANVAALLAREPSAARNGHRVVCIDFDLDAGGLHTIFGVPLQEIRWNLLDILASPGPPEAERALVNLTHLLGSASPDAQLFLMPAVTEIKRLNDIDWNRDLHAILRNLIEQIETAINPHFILIDGRSGFAELATPPIRTAERIVCVLRPNRQNTDGLRLFLDVLESLRGERPKTFLVLSQVPSVRDAAERVGALENLLGHGRHFDTQIPLFPELAFDERVVTLTDPRHEFATAYMPIARWLLQAE